MRKMTAIGKRILSQFAHDKRTLALLFIAPIFVLWLLSMLLGAANYVPTVAAVALPDDYLTVLEEQEIKVTTMSQGEAQALLNNNEVDAVLTYSAATQTLTMAMEGSSRTKTAAVRKAVADATSDFGTKKQEEMQADMEEKTDDIRETMARVSAMGMVAKGDTADFDFNLDAYLPVQTVDTTYLHGSDDWETFDYLGPIFIGIFVFVFTFLTSGMSLVNEKSRGTMARFLATPVKSWQILGGYSLGFGLLALVQATVIIVIALTLIGFPNEGNLFFVVLIAVSLAVASVTMGLLVSGLAGNAFQVVQLMLLFVVPQILLCGLFDLSGAPGWLQTLSDCLPLTYGVDAMSEVMLRGSGFAAIRGDMLVVWGFIVLFFLLAAMGFRKKRVSRAAKG